MTLNGRNIDLKMKISPGYFLAETWKLDIHKAIYVEHDIDILLNIPICLLNKHKYTL